MGKKGKSLIERLYDDSVRNFVAQLVDADTVSKEELLELRDYLDNLLEEE